MSNSMPRPKTRTDDSHAAPVRPPSPGPEARVKSRRQLVRFPGYCRIKPHAPPFVQTPANLIKSPALRLFPRRGASRMRGPGRGPAQHPWLRARTTGVSNTDRTPRFRGSVSIGGGGPPWPLGAGGPSADFTPGTHLPPPSPRCQAQGVQAAVATPGCDPDDPGNLATLYAQSRPVMLTQRCLTATAGTSLVRASVGGQPGSGPRGGAATPLPHENASSGLRPVTKIPHCCLGRGPLRPRVAGRPQSPARDHRLEPTPNPPQPHR